MTVTSSKRRSGPRDVFPDAHGILARAGARAVAPRKTPESEKPPQLRASEAVSAATAAVSDMSQFCKRQPVVCEIGGQAATVIGHRAQEGARKLYQIFTDKRPLDHTGSIVDIENSDAHLKEMARRTTR